MKKNSKYLGKDYSKIEDNYTSLEYYGVLIKNNRVRIDTKRYKKFFKLPDDKIEHRNSVYYVPTKIHRSDYYCNWFYDLSIKLKDEWNNEFANIIKTLKSPKEVEDNVRVNNLMDGVYDYDEAYIIGKMSGIKRIDNYKYLIKTIYAQFFQQMMAQFDALALKVIVLNGYQNRNFSREAFDSFIQGKQKIDVKSFYDYGTYDYYNRSYRIWNFLKHNSTKSYDQLIKSYPNLIYDPDSSYKNGDPAILVLKLDEKLIINTLDNLPKFFDEVCQRGFGENPNDAKWDYDDYFLNEVKDRIETIENPLGLPDWL